MPDRDPQQIQLQVADNLASGSYANFALLNHTENEFVFDFAFIQPGKPQAKVVSRIISSPKHTKRLLLAMQKNLERYEQRFGEIDIKPPTQPPPPDEPGDPSLH